MTDPPLAEGGHTVTFWMTDETWITRLAALSVAGYEPEEIEVVWFMVVDGNADNPLSPTVAQLEAVLTQIRNRLVNLKLLFMGSYPYGGFKIPSAEPGMWNSGRVVREFINAHLGETNPWIGWGPYHWANGTVPRTDGFSWEPANYIGGGSNNIHLSVNGRVKAAQLLEDFFHASALTSWFRS